MNNDQKMEYKQDVYVDEQIDGHHCRDYRYVAGLAHTQVHSRRVFGRKTV